VLGYGVMTRSPQAQGCLATAASRTAAGHQVLIVAAPPSRSAPPAPRRSSSAGRGATIAEAFLNRRISSAYRKPDTRRAKQLGIDVVGYETGLYGEAYVTGVDEAVALLRTMGPADAALVKGSRVVRLEDVVRAYGEAEGVPSLTPGAGAAAGACV
jgi:hypothetical protein